MVYTCAMLCINNLLQYSANEMYDAQFQHYIVYTSPELMNLHACLSPNAHTHTHTQHDQEFMDS